MSALWQQLRQGLSKTSLKLKNALSSVFSDKKLLPERRAALAEILLSSDMGPSFTEKILGDIHRQEDLFLLLTQHLKTYEKSFHPEGHPWIVLVVGVNGSGKTTTLGKLAFQWSEKGHHVRLISADTFRAAAHEQLHIWAQRSQSFITIADNNGQDPASVVFKGLQEAKASCDDIILIDTAGRLPNKIGLMEEIQKIDRLIKKNMPTSAVYEKILVLDATTGQHALAQAKLFHQCLDLTGLIMTKLDGTSGGGILFSITQELQLPICAIGLGETTAALQPFEAESFVNSLLQDVLIEQSEIS